MSWKRQGWSNNRRFHGLVPTVSAANLVAFLNQRNWTSFGSTARWRDLSPNKNDMVQTTADNQPSVVRSGRFGATRNYDGTNDYMVQEPLYSQSSITDLYLSTVDGTAFFYSDSLDFSNYRGKFIRIFDEDSSKYLWGYISSTAPGGLPAWYDVTGAASYPKGCNDNALGDQDDGTVIWESDGYSNCGKTGSAGYGGGAGNVFAKSTHNGQGCGIADLNGLMWEISIGVTCITSGGGAIEDISRDNPAVVTITGHGRATGDPVMLTGITIGDWAGLANKIYSITKLTDDTFELDGVNTSGFSDAYVVGTNGGTITAGDFYAAKETAAMADFSPGNSGPTDHWGATGVAAMMDAFDPPFETGYSGNGFTQRLGSGANQVLSETVSGAGWLLTGLMAPKDKDGIDNTGTNLFGKDYFYQYVKDELCLLSGGNWASAADAGVCAVGWSYHRANSYSSVGFRLACYPGIGVTSSAVIKTGPGAGLGYITDGLPAGFTALDGYNNPDSGNFGNYQYSDGSVMGWVPKFYYKVLTGSDANTILIASTDDYATTVAANAAGYALHRAFIDGGIEQPGFFIDKYMCSKNAKGTGFVASSVQNGLPLSTASEHNPIADLTACAGNFYYETINAAHARDGIDGAVNVNSIFHVSSRFQYSAMAMLSIAINQNSCPATGALCESYPGAGDNAVTGVEAGFDPNSATHTVEIYEPDLNIAGALTILAWVANENANDTAVSKFDSGFAIHQKSISLGFESNGFARIQVAADGINLVVEDDDADISDGTFHFVGGTFVPSTSLTIFVDGVQESQQTAGIPASIYDGAPRFGIGGLNFDSGIASAWSGQIAQVIVFSRALSAAEIKEITKHLSSTRRA